MNKNHIFCFGYILLFSLLVLPALASATTVAQVASSYVEPQEKYELNKLSAGGSDYWIVTIDGVETMMIDSHSQILQSKDEIAAVLILNLKETSGVASKTQQIRDLINAFNQSQYPERTVCERTTGVDAMPCYDHDTCLKACYRVPLCAMQIREDLILAIQYWNTERKNVDTAVIAAKEGAKDPQTQTDYQDLSSQITIMEDAMQAMEDNELYDYPYCLNMNATYGDADSAKELADEIATVLGTISQTNTRAENIYNKMNERVNYWNSRDKTYKDGYNAVLDGYEEVKSMYAKASWTDNVTAAAIEDAKNYSEIVQDYKEAGQYKLAIKQADQYKGILSKLKTSIQMTSAQYEVLKSKANTALADIESAKPKLNGTKYEANLTAYKKEIDGVLGKKVDKSQISALISRMDEIDSSVKDMLAEAVLSGEINNNGNGNGGITIPPIPGTGTDTGGANPLCGIINAISSALGFSVDFLGMCK